MTQFNFLREHPYFVNQWGNEKTHMGFEFDREIDGEDYHIVIVVPSTLSKKDLGLLYVNLNGYIHIDFEQTADWYQQLVYQTMGILND